MFIAHYSSRFNDSPSFAQLASCTLRTCCNEEKSKWPPLTNQWVVLDEGLSALINMLRVQFEVMDTRADRMWSNVVVGFEFEFTVRSKFSC